MASSPLWRCFWEVLPVLSAELLHYDYTILKILTNFQFSSNLLFFKWLYLKASTILFYSICQSWRFRNVIILKDLCVKLSLNPSEARNILKMYLIILKDLCVKLSLNPPEAPKYPDCPWHGHQMSMTRIRANFMQILQMHVDRQNWQTAATCVSECQWT